MEGARAAGKRRVALVRTGDAAEADDLTQDVLILMIRRLDSFQGDSVLLDGRAPQHTSLRVEPSPPSRGNSMIERESLRRTRPERRDRADRRSDSRRKLERRTESVTVESERRDGERRDATMRRDGNRRTGQRRAATNRRLIAFA